MRLGVIRFMTFEPCIITPEEYDQINRDVQARFIAGDSGPGDRVLARLVTEHAMRREELRQRGSEAHDVP